jgi:hypothetical protein
MVWMPSIVRFRKLLRLPPIMMLLPSKTVDGVSPAICMMARWVGAARTCWPVCSEEISAFSVFIVVGVAVTSMDVEVWPTSSLASNRWLCAAVCVSTLLLTSWNPLAETVTT